MHHWRAIGVAAAFTVGCTALLVTIACFVSWQLALKDQRERLTLHAEHTVQHIQAAYQDISNALHLADASGFKDCSPAHVLRLRDITRNTVSVDNMAYAPGEIVECNSWGPLTRRLPTIPPAFIMPDGIGILPNWLPSQDARGPQMILTFAGHAAVVDQQRLFGAPGGGDGLTILAMNGVALKRRGHTSPGPDPAGDVLEETARGGGWTVTARATPPAFGPYLLGAWPVLRQILPLLAVLSAGMATLILRARLSPSSELKRAIINREIVAHYQPIVELATGRCIGAEALARWRRPNGDLVRPDAFIPLAEDTGLIQPITDMIVDLIIVELGDLLRRTPRMHVALNLSAADINTGRILTVLERKLAGTGIAPQQIWLEATESSLLDLEGTHRTLAEARRRGHWTAIDDFGTGYSGLQYLQRLPIDALKIDKSFIDSVGTEASTRHVTEHIIAMAQALKLDVIAEGVESELQVAYLRERQVAFAQGWLFSRAVPAAELIAFCNRTERAAASARGAA
ncbi:EAL domain-containing protein [Ancylobacter pratisalsi]|uniref:cyclic-guanylate-specific phosphodiesterase n=1 Tax=Ancylobacter pratisalsi TaxID=1745854 RepID=A0A6P1YQG9_9HYPH|nr:EAL domain-containing protein [Ancylobacter pratisalsi]QIB33974.1 EAL domain-containing protein [Ancylobacter pratisalsi]